MWDVSLHDTIDTRLHTPAPTRQFDHAPPYTRFWALANKNGTNYQYFHFRLSSGGQHCQGEASPQAKQLPHIQLCFWWWLLNVSRTVWETTIHDDCYIRSCRMSSRLITINKFNCTNYGQWATETAQLLERMQVYGVVKWYDNNLEEPAANVTATVMAAVKD
jgi:hypothetical protein